MKLFIRAFSLSVLSLFIAGAAYAQVSANFTASPTSGCAPLIVTFTNTSTGTITGNSWNFGNSGTSTLQNPSTTYTSPGNYTVTLTVRNASNQTSTKTLTITVHPNPTVSFTFNNAAGCAPHPVQFTSTVVANAPGSLQYTWDFGDGFGNSSANPSHTYASGSATPYPVSLMVRNSYGCSTTVVRSNAITVYPKPTGTFSGYPTSACRIPATVNFTSSTAGSGAVIVSWDFGDGGTGSGSSTSHTYTRAGTFTVKMYMTDSRGCKDSVVQNSYITTYSNPGSFTAPASICQSGRYTAPPGIVTYNPFPSPYWPIWYNAHESINRATFTNTTSGATMANTYWKFSDGHTDTGGTVSHAFYTAGNDTVRMITDLGGCFDTVYKIITVHPIPNVGMSFSPSPNCPAPTTLTLTASGASSYQWLWSTGATATGNPVSRSYPTDGFTEGVMVIGTSAYGCKDTLFATDTIYNIRINYNSELHGCAPYTMIDSVFLESDPPKFKLYPGSNRIVSQQTVVSSYHWDFGDGNSSNAEFPVHIYTKPGIYRRILTITTKNGCTVKDTAKVYVGSKVKPSFTFPDSVCTKTQVYFTNTTPRAPDSSLTYTWDVGESYTPINNRDAIASYFRPDTYNITLYVDSNGCRDSTVCLGCLTILPPNANFIDSNFCAPNLTSVKFINQSIGTTSILWNFGDGNTSTSFSPVHSYTTTGLYNVRLTTHNNVTGCRDTMTKPILITPITIDFVTDTTVCRGDAMTLTPSYTGTAWKKEYEWFIDGTNYRYDSLLRPMTYIMDDVNVNPAGILPPVAGYHNITFRVIRSSLTGGKCVDSIRKSNYVIVSRPTPAFGASSLIGCTPLTVNFSDSSLFTPGTASSNRTWTFGDGGTASNNSSTSSYTYTTAGLYNVKLKVTDWNGCADSLTKAGYIEARRPKADFTVNIQNACAYQPLTFTNLSFGATRLSYKWYFGDGDSSLALGPQHAYKAPGTYTVRLIVTDSTFCSDTVTKAAFIGISRPTAGFTMSDSVTVCPPLTVNFTSTSTGATSLAWDFGNSGTAVISNPVSTFNSPGVYNVRLIARDLAGCPDTATATVRVLGYSGALTYTPLSGCAPLTVQYTAGVTNIPSMVWDFSDGTILPATGPTASHTYLTPGSYVPKLIFSDGTGCSSSSTGLDTIKVDDVIAGFKVLPPCEKTNLQIFDTSKSFFSPIKDTRWDFAGSGIATGNPVNRSYPLPGTYPVTLISTNANGCKDTLSRNITIHPLPRVIAPADTAVCIPDAITLSASGALTYSWSPATFLSCTACNNPVASPNTAVSYVVTGTDSNGCAAKDTVRIAMQTKTTFVTNGNGEICLGQTYQLSASGATVYSWTPPSTLDDPAKADPKASPKVNTTYIVTAREGSCLADTHSIRVVVRPLPTVDAGGDMKVVAGNAVLLQASGTGITRVAWEDEASLSCHSCYAPEARPKVSTTYRITAYNEYGCTATDSVRVLVLCDGSQLFIPNTFTPNGDGMNDFFFPRGQGIDRIRSFRVYSRWGELLFEGKDMAVNDEYKGWNGTYNGRKLNPDVYVYIIEAVCDTGEPLPFKGDITLIR